MIQAIFRFLLNLVATLVQIVVSPINLLFVNLLPNVSDKITQVNNGISSLFAGMGWALGLLPPGVLPVLIFIITIEIAKHTIWANSHMIIKVWNVLQKIKFW